MGRVTYERATEEHCRLLAPRLRAADTAEVRASHGLEPLDALLYSLRTSEVAFAGFVDGDIAAIGGITRGSPLGSSGGAWLLTSDVVDRFPVTFVRESRRVLAVLRERYPTLFVHVDARYVASLGWLRLLGFKVAWPEPYGAQGFPFCRVTLGV